MESSEDYGLNKLDALYRSYFGSDFPSAQQLSREAELCLEYVHFIDNHPTVLVSLGSVANSTQMPREWKDEFVKLFDSMKDVHFIWKYDGTDVQTPKNVLIKKWIPQNELLKSGKVTAFLTHAGYNSLSESLYAAVPVVLLPTFADQSRNANLAKVRGIGLIVKKSEVQAEVLAERISTVVNNSSYLIAARKYQKASKEQTIYGRREDCSLESFRFKQLC
ncbi:UDP-glucuronosyltransferase [Aphelenchoides besseyi]|nr:UDP-glucuronosyltransferase [Aphelenchoides besseyi]